MKIEELDLSVRAWRTLKDLGIDTVEQLIGLIKTENWGKRVCHGSRAIIAEIAQKLDEMGLLDYASVAIDSGYDESALRRYHTNVL